MALCWEAFSHRTEFLQHYSLSTEYHSEARCRTLGPLRSWRMVRLAHQQSTDFRMLEMRGSSSRLLSWLGSLHIAFADVYSWRATFRVAQLQGYVP